MTDPYSLQLLQEAHAKINALVESKTPGTQSWEYYYAMSQALFALDYAMRENTAMKNSFNNLVKRMEINEALIARLVKEE